MDREEPYSNYRLTVRVRLENTPGLFATVASTLGEMGALLGAVDIVDASHESIVRDVTFNANTAQHGEEVVTVLKKLEGVEVIAASDQIFVMHLGGKLNIRSKVPLTTRSALSQAYTPGVARVCTAIAEDREKAFSLTIKHNTVAVVSDGSAVLGLGNIGPEAAMPVMEGKAMLFKEFANVDAWPVCLDTQDTEEIIATVKAIAPGFGGINLEDIAAPRCFEIERRLVEELDIPVMHDDQHGTAVVTLAALYNALRVTGKQIGDIRVAMSGMGAGGQAVAKLLILAGVRHFAGTRSTGCVIDVHGDDALAWAQGDSSFLHYDQPSGTIHDIIKGADLFVGLSIANVLDASDIEAMADDPMVFAMANPDPEIDPIVGSRLARVFATGRSDFPNQINNVLAFPGIFRGLLDVRAQRLTENMQLAAAKAIAALISDTHLSADFIVPSVFNKRVARVVARAVAATARGDRVARSRSRTGKKGEGITV